MPVIFITARCHHSPDGGFEYPIMRDDIQGLVRMCVCPGCWSVLKRAMALNCFADAMKKQLVVSVEKE